MTTATLFELLLPGELLVRREDGSLLRTMTVSDIHVARELGPVNVRKLMRKLTVVKPVKKR
ncbi:hypothetical protein [Bradyrhizobium sp. LHD-71]|jgi:hypothetical protein|uniref:hypothetical protein n=1 Tax=Bradyrhizobium sp. LHD-71 TaxID=3072141 RepID=UPI00280DFACF|nr:hypothetical protein [Bradyrhizobium sp. LHD-71]MDQ8726444.1 hypothetical protein [Bradyrhizobium sp. LHD-71]